MRKIPYIVRKKCHSSLNFRANTMKMIAGEKIENALHGKNKKAISGFGGSRSIEI